MRHQIECDDEPYRRGTYYLPLDAPVGMTITVRDTVPGPKDGPCLLLLFQQEMPPIDDLDRTTKYSLGVTMRLIGFSLDEQSVEPSAALRIYGELAEAADDHMQRYRLGECGPFSVKHLIDALLRITGPIFADLDIRQMVDAYVAHALTMKLHPDVGPLPAGEISADRTITDACRALIGRVPTFHIPAAVFDQCEMAEWPALKFKSDILPSNAFLIAVDGETWLPIANTLSSAQDDWVLVDARDLVWYVYEQTRVRGLDVRQNATQIVGSTFDVRTSRCEAIPSTSVFTEEDGVLKPFTWPESEARRAVQIAVSFMLLIRNTRVALEPSRLIGHWNVRLPEGSTVTELITEVLDFHGEQGA